MSNSEMVDANAKEAGKDMKEGPLNIDINNDDGAKMVSGEAKHPPLPSKPTENEEMDRDVIMEEDAKGKSLTVQAADKDPHPSQQQQQTHEGKDLDMPDAEALEPLLVSQASVELTSANPNTSGMDDDGEDVKLKPQENDGKGADHTNSLADAKQLSDSKNEVSCAQTSNDKSSEIEANLKSSEATAEDEVKGKEVNDIQSPDDKSSEAKPEDDEKGEKLKDVHSSNDKSLETNAESDAKGEQLKDVHLLNDTKAEDDEKRRDLKEAPSLNEKPSEIKAEDSVKGEEWKNGVTKMDLSPKTEIKKEVPKPKLDTGHEIATKTTNRLFLFDPSSSEGYESGTEEEQTAFMKEVETFYRENSLEFKAPKFYKEELNLLKLWRAVIKLGGYEQVTSCKLWRQVGESFRPPKTCTTVSWTFRIFYEKALLEYEKSKIRTGELSFSDGSVTESIVRGEIQAGGSQALGSGRARRDAAARAMQGWHSQRLLGSGQVCHPIIKDKNLSSTPKVDKQLKTNGLLKRKKPSTVEHAVHVPHMKMMKPQGDAMVIDIGPPADWVKINVQRTNDCFEIYALVPGLLREEVHVQSDPAGRLIISGQPEQLDNPWGVTPFKKVVSLPSRIDPHQTSAVVTLHGQLFVRVPFEQSDL